MAGHSKWAQIKRQKAVIDAKKSKIFGKLSRLIALESKKANGNINAPGLRSVIEKAKSANMPNENIERAVKKGAGDSSTVMEFVLYEGYGPGGSALIIEGLTDNKNRTSAEIKHILSKNGANLAPQGAASWAFQKTSEGWIPQTSVDLSPEDARALKNLIDQLEDNDDIQGVHTNANIPE
jgi:YebC/PmpR family DNA-binding regulatory protein